MEASADQDYEGAHGILMRLLNGDSYSFGVGMLSLISLAPPRRSHTPSPPPHTHGVANEWLTGVGVLGGPLDVEHSLNDTYGQLYTRVF